MVSDWKNFCLEKASRFRPTIDRPFFNIYLWDYFNRAVGWATAGRFQPKDFEFTVGKQPLSEPRPVLLFYCHVLCGYIWREVPGKVM